jgi:hypothetical protein
MLKNAEDIARAAYDASANKDDDALRYALHLWELYIDWQDEAEKHGLVGVGCITYAQDKLVAYQMLLEDVT